LVESVFSLDLLVENVLLHWIDLLFYWAKSDVSLDWLSVLYWIESALLLDGLV